MKLNDCNSCFTCQVCVTCQGKCETCQVCVEAQGGSVQRSTPGITQKNKLSPVHEDLKRVEKIEHKKKQIVI